MGVDLDEQAGEEDVGGWAAEMLYLRHRYVPEPYMMGAELERFYGNTLAPKVRRLEDLLEPSHRDHAAFDLALRVRREYERHGPPNLGGRRDQPAWWLFVRDCADLAVERAEATNRREDARIDKAKGEG